MVVVDECASHGLRGNTRFNLPTGWGKKVWLFSLRLTRSVHPRHYDLETRSGRAVGAPLIVSNIVTQPAVISSIKSTQRTCEGNYYDLLQTVF